MTAIELLNLSLFKIGVSKTVTSLAEASRQAYTGALVYDHRLRMLLRLFPWPFATKYATPLTLVAGPAWDEDAVVQEWDAAATYKIGDVVDSGGTFYYCILGHTNQVPPNSTYWDTEAPDEVNGDWLYAYRWPTDCLFARRIVPDLAAGMGRQFNADPPPFRVGFDVNGLLIYSNQREAELEYTANDCDALWADDLFIDAFTWHLAAALAPSLSKNGLTTKDCLQFFLVAVQLARTTALNEGQQEKDGDPDWIANR